MSRWIALLFLASTSYAQINDFRGRVTLVPQATQSSSAVPLNQVQGMVGSFGVTDVTLTWQLLNNPFPVASGSTGGTTPTSPYFAGYGLTLSGQIFSVNTNTIVVGTSEIIVNTTTNQAQTVLNLQAGSNVTLTQSGNSPTTTVTIASSGGGGGNGVTNGDTSIVLGIIGTTQSVAVAGSYTNALASTNYVKSTSNTLALATSSAAANALSAQIAANNAAAVAAAALPTAQTNEFASTNQNVSVFPNDAGYINNSNGGYIPTNDPPISIVGSVVITNQVTGVETNFLSGTVTNQPIGILTNQVTGTQTNFVNNTVQVGFTNATIVTVVITNVGINQLAIANGAFSNSSISGTTLTLNTNNPAGMITNNLTTTFNLTNALHSGISSSAVTITTKFFGSVTNETIFGPSNLFREVYGTTTSHVYLNSGSL